MFVLWKRRHTSLKLTQILLVLGVALFLLTGCQFTRGVSRLDEPPPRPFVPKNVYASNYLPKNLRRVAMLPCYYEDELAPHLQYMDATLLSELNRKSRFEIVPVSRKQMHEWFGEYQFDSTDELPDDLLNTIKSETAADAIVFVDITHFFPYKPIALGVRSKLVDISTGKILWAFDDLFDAGSPGVAYSAKQFQKFHDRASYPLDSSSSVLQSPRKFIKYVAFEVFRTLPEH